jgi:hypothetical protein
MKIGKLIASIAAAILLAGDVSGWSQTVANQPTTSGSARLSRQTRRHRESDNSLSDEGIRIPQPAEMSKEFEILNDYSLFTKGRLPDRSSDSSGGGGSFNAQAPENVLVFTGVTVTDHATVGFIEDTTQQTVRMVKVGDSIAQGKITDINLDVMNYQTNSGRKVRVAVGQNLRGENAFGLIYGTGIDSGGPVVTDQNVDPGTAAILQRMRAKRLAELNGTAAPATQPAEPPQ